MSESLVVIPISVDYFKIVPTASYGVLNLETLEKVQVMGYDLEESESEYYNLTDGIITPVSLFGREWKFDDSDMDIYYRLVVSNEGFVFLERYINGALVRSGFTGIILSKITSYLTLKSNYIYYGDNDGSDIYPLLSGTLYSSRIGNYERYTFDSKPDMYAPDLTSSKALAKLKRLSLVNKDYIKLVDMTLNGEDFIYESPIVSFPITGILNKNLLVEFKKEDPEHTVSMSRDDINLYLNTVVGLHILAESTMLFIAGLRANRVFILFNENKVIVSSILPCWDKVYHGGNKVRAFDYFPLNYRLDFPFWDVRDFTSEDVYDGCYIDGITASEFKSILHKLPFLCEGLYDCFSSGVKSFCTFFEETFGRKFELKTNALDVLKEMKFPKLNGQIESDTFITGDYYYYRGFCLKLQTYEKTHLRRAYRGDTNPRFSTIERCFRKWIDCYYKEE